MNENVSENIWNVFELASQAGKEADALLDLIASNLTNDEFSNNISSVKEITYLDENSNTDKSGWVFCNETRSYDVTPKGKQKAKYIIGIQVVFFDHESNVTANQATLNICLHCDSSSEAFESENWFVASDDSDEWEGYSVETKGMTIANLTENSEFSQDGENDILFCIPLGALTSPDDVELKVMKPLSVLLEYLDPNNPEVIKVFEKVEGIIMLDEVSFPGTKRN